jgi:diacylglycerol kinase family enzyme
MTVHVILNRQARHLVADRGLRSALLAESRGARVHETSTLEDLDRVVLSLADQAPRCVVLAGGDGTYMASLTALERVFGEHLPPVALAPGGTVGTVARNLVGTKHRTAHRVMQAALAEPLRTGGCPTLRITDNLGGSRVGFIFGAGLVSSFFDEYYALERRGLTGAAWIVAKVFAGSFVGARLTRKVLSPMVATLRVDGVQQKPQAWSLVVASVVRDLGLHMRLTYRAAEREDRVHLVASALGPRELGPQMPRVLRGVPLRGQGHVDTLTQSLELEFPGEGGTYILDGEPFRARVVRVVAGPVVRVVRPVLKP